MSAPLILNLDDLAADEKSITLDGTKHVAVEMTVETYISRVKKAKEVKPDATMADKVDDAVTFLVEVYPSVTEARMRKLSLKQLNALIDFTLKAPEDIAKGVEAANAKAGAGNA